MQFYAKLQADLYFDEEDGLVLIINGSDETDLVLNDLLDTALVDFKSDGDYRIIFNVAHELNRWSERYREVATVMEDHSLYDRH